MRSPLVAIAAIVAAAIRLFWILRRVLPEPALDFSNFYLWAWAIRHNIDPYGPDLTPYADRLGISITPIPHSNYPPTFLLAFEPFSWMAPWTAYWVWAGLTVVLLIASVTLILAEKNFRWPEILIVTSFAIVYRPVFTHFIYLQAQIVILFLLVMMWRALQRRNDFAAGGWLAFAGLLKIFPLFMMLYLLCTRRWRALGYTLILFAAGFALTVAIIGPLSFGFFSTLMEHAAPAAGTALNPKIGIASTIVRIFGRLAPDASSHTFVFGRMALEAMLELIVLWLTARAIAHSRSNPLKAEYAFGMCVAGMVLFYPNSWSHYMVLLLLPLCQIVVATERGQAPVFVPQLAVISFVLAEVSYNAAQKSIWHKHMNLGLWLIEGMFVSTLITYAAAYILTVGAEGVVRED